MIRISTKGRYSLRMMMDLARHFGEGPVMLREIAERQAISEKYLGQIIFQLRAANLIRSTRGAHGGYSLVKSPENITVKDIVEAVEGSINLVECVNAPAICDRADDCIARIVWTRAAEKVSDYLESIKLSYIVRMGQKQKTPSARSSKKK